MSLASLMSFLLCFLTNMLITHATSTDESSFERVERCRGATVEILKTNEQLPPGITLQSEKEIAREGSLSGFFPITYDLELDFKNDTYYTGNVTIYVKVVRETSHLVVNIGRLTPKIQHENVQVYWRRDNPGVPPNMWCISNITEIRSLEVLLISFSRSLSISSNLFVKFGEISSKSVDENNNERAKGLRESVIDNSYALFTFFFMREARTVFPCMDQPALKSTFRLCLVIDHSFTPISNTDTEPPNVHPNRNRLRYCFNRTPFVISVHTFGFALLRGYVKMRSADWRMQLFVPQSRQGSFPHVLSDATRAMDYMTNITNYPLPFNCTTLFVVKLLAFTGRTSAGLIALDLAQIEMAETGSFTSELVYHEIFHLWIGTIVSVKDWKNVCLSEGLVIYLSWLLLVNGAADGIRKTVHQQTRAVIKNQYDFRRNATGTDINELWFCYKQSPLIFHMLAVKLGGTNIKTFAAKLVQSYAMDSAGMLEWDSTASIVAGMGYFTGSFFSRWFTNAGPTTLEVTFGLDTVTVRQRTDNEVEFNRHVSVELVCSYNSNTRRLNVLGDGATINIDQNDQWCLVDPDSQTLTRKIYMTHTYWMIFGGVADNYSLQLTSDRLEDFMEDFCYVFLRDQLPLDQYPSYDKWLTILEIVGGRTTESSKCNCCATQIKKVTPDCFYMTDNCNGLKLIRSIQGYLVEGFKF